MNIMFLCVCVCVCARKRERERERAVCIFSSSSFVVFCSLKDFVCKPLFPGICDTLYSVCVCV